jgi:hypothetical protein
VVDGHRSPAPASHSVASCSRSDAAKRRRRRTGSGSVSCCLRVARTAAASRRRFACRINSSRRWRAIVRRSRWIITVPGHRVSGHCQNVSSTSRKHRPGGWHCCFSSQPTCGQLVSGRPRCLAVPLGRSRIHTWWGGAQPLRLQMAHLLIASMQRLGRVVAALAIRDAQPRQPTGCARRCPAW